MADNVKVLPVGAKLNSGAAEYTVVRVLGAGGFGVTYLVTTNIKHGNVSFQVNMALKEHFRSALCDRDLDSNQVVVSNPVREEVENSLKDFLSEARRLQHVGSQHRNIVKVNEVFQGNNTAYYVMEYLEGQSLRNYVMQFGALSQEQMTEVMRPIVDAVSYLHSQHMTHLDIKPDNIIVTRDEDGSLRPVLIDFGLAKHYTDDGHPTSTINTLGCSDGYAPAEQYAGITTFSPKADVYALGATILFCLTGKNPRKSTELSRAELEDTLNKLKITPELRTALLGAMAYIPMDRTASAEDILPGSGALQANVSTSSSPTTPLAQPDYGKTKVIPNTETDNSTSVVSAEYDEEEPRRPWLKYGIIAAGAIAVIIGILAILWPKSSYDSYPVEEYAEDTLLDSIASGEDDIDVAPDNQIIENEQSQERVSVDAGVETPTQRKEISNNSNGQNQELSDEQVLGMIQAISYSHGPREQLYIEEDEFQGSREENVRQQYRLIDRYGTPHNLDLAVRRGNLTLYFNKDNWQEQYQSGDTKLGVVIINGNEQFIIALEDLAGGEEMYWNEAMRRFGSRLPTKDQAQAMADLDDEINSAIFAYGGVIMYYVYWTKTEHSADRAWYVSIPYGPVDYNNKGLVEGRVRAVISPLPQNVIYR